MTGQTILNRRPLRGLAALLALLAVAGAAPASAATWRLEPIAGSVGVAGLQDLQFDANGRAVLSWNGLLRGRTPPAFAGLATRDPAGGWQRPPDLDAVQPRDAQIHVFGITRTLLVAREAQSPANRRRLVVADGSSDGGFGTVVALDDFVRGAWSAVNPAGEALVAWTDERSPFVKVAERGVDGRFAAVRERAVAGSAAVAINARGTRVLAFTSRRRLAARVRQRDRSWGPTQRFGPLFATPPSRLTALVVRNGRVVVTWGGAGRECGVSVRDGGGRWATRRLERRCGPAAVGPRGSAVIPFADGRGATYVAWTGRTSSGRQAVKLARVGPGASRRALVLSRERGAVLDDVAAGPRRSLAVTWTAPRPRRDRRLLLATYAALRRDGSSFGRGDRLTPASVFVAPGSRVAFQPLTGEPVVAVPFLVGRDAAVGAAVGPPAPCPQGACG